jgi:predicted membrane protein (TIGR00267 family)
MNNSTLKQYPGPHERQNGADTNKLRAAVLGANDGTVSVASIIVGVAGATNSSLQIITAGIAGLVAGAISMGVGEYVSVSSQRDTEKVLLEKERHLLAAFPEEELKELELLYKSKGLSTNTAQQVAKELSAAIASSLAFTAGALVPLIVIALVRGGLRVPLTIVAVILALIATGLLSARASGASKLHSTRRVVVGGLIAMLVTYCIGYLVGHVTSG